MLKQLILEDQSEMSYTLKKSRRARRLRVAVHRGGSVVVTVPARCSSRVAQEFVREHRAWILRKQALLSEQKYVALPEHTRAEYLEHKEAARALVESRVAHFNEIYQFSYNDIRIKNQKSRWGSCSGKKNLNFNYKLIFLPPHLADYIIVHELCHLAELNHSSRFWAQVACTCPEYQQYRKELAVYALHVD